MHIAKLEPALGRCEGDGIIPVLDGRIGVEDFENPVCRRPALLGDRIQRTERAQLRRRDSNGPDHADKIAERCVALGNPPGGEAENTHQRQATRNLEDRIDRRLVRQDFQEQTLAFDEALAGARLLIVLQSVGLDHAGRLEAL